MTLDLPICCNFQKNLQMAKNLQLAQTFFINGQSHYISKHHRIITKQHYKRSLSMVKVTIYPNIIVLASATTASGRELSYTTPACTSTNGVRCLHTQSRARGTTKLNATWLPLDSSTASSCRLPYATARPSSAIRCIPPRRTSPRARVGSAGATRLGLLWSPPTGPGTRRRANPIVIGHWSAPAP